MPAPDGPISRLLRYRRLIAVIAGVGTSFAFAPVRTALPRLDRSGSPVPALGIRVAAGGGGHQLLVRRRALRRGHLVDLTRPSTMFGQAPAWLALFLVGALLAIKGAYYALLGYVVMRIAPDPVARALAAADSRGLDADGVAARLAVHGIPVAAARLFAERFAARGARDARRHPPRHLRGRGDRGCDHRGVLPGWRRADRRRSRSRGALWLGGWLLDGREWTRPTGEPVDIALLQGAIPQDEKWLVENRAATLEKYRELNREALGAQIIVWPESAVPDACARGACPTSRPSAASRRRADPTSCSGSSTSTCRRARSATGSIR